LRLRSTYLLAIGVALTISSAITATASWQGPEEMVSGSWGSNNEQFGIKYGDTNDVFGGPIYLLIDGSYIVTDLMNGRRKVYDANGALTKVVRCVKNPNGEWNDVCRIPLSN
jgi:hypothetical protein